MTETNDRRSIAEIQSDLAEARKELRSIMMAAGDDYGCDGTKEEAQSWRYSIRMYENELAAARAENAKRKAMSGQMRRLSGAVAHEERSFRANMTPEQKAREDRARALVRY